LIPADIINSIRSTKLEMQRRDPVTAQRQLERIGVGSETPFGQFFLQFEGGYAVANGMKELLDIAGPAFPAIPDVTRYICENCGVPETYVCLTSPEGEGFVLYDRVAGAVFDTGLDELPALLAGEVTPRWATFFDYLRDYFRKTERDSEAVGGA
jgi:hypothetical protein